MSFFFSFLSFSFKLRERERERGYTKFGIRRHSPKGTYLISLMEFRGESFFFYGLIDFMLFLILAWRKWLLSVSQNFFVFFYPEYLALVLSPTNPAQQLTFSFHFFADGKKVLLPFWGPSQSLGFSLPPPGRAISLGLLDVTQVPFFSHQVTKYKHLFLTVILWWLATVNSNTGNSINLISIVSVGDHVTLRPNLLRDQPSASVDSQSAFPSYHFFFSLSFSRN